MNSYMKCAVCGKDFGNGTNCQNCGTDRVTGLGNYNGYSSPSKKTTKKDSSTSNGEKTNQEIVSEPKITVAGSMVCYSCGEIIPSESKFCPYCSKKLYVTCPQCGNTYSSQFPACNMCGTNRKTFLREMKKKGKLFEIPYGTISISPFEFKNKNYEYVSIPSTVTSINESAFEGCKQLKEISIPDSVCMIGDCAFYECESLREIVIPNAVHSIGKRAFAYCLSLQRINLPCIQVVEDSYFLDVNH